MVKKGAAMKRFTEILSYSYSTAHGHRWVGEAEGVAWQPLIDVCERPREIIIIVELPGVDEDKIKVSVERSILRISGVRKKLLPNDTQRMHQMEIPYGPFARSVQLPACSDIAHIEADYHQGYLTIKVPRT